MHIAQNLTMQLQKLTLRLIKMYYTVKVRYEKKLRFKQKTQLHRCMIIIKTKKFFILIKKGQKTGQRLITQLKF